MNNDSGSLVSVNCPLCGIKMQIPAYKGEYKWATDDAYSATHDWYCVNCGEKHTVKVKRHIHSAEIVRAVEDE